jgi:hypothetical protein
LFEREIEMSEVQLKADLSQNKSDDVARRIIAENRPVGLSIVEFPVQNQCFEIAVSLAEDPHKRFDMILRTGDLQSAPVFRSIIFTFDPRFSDSEGANSMIFQHTEGGWPSECGSDGSTVGSPDADGVDSQSHWFLLLNRQSGY